MGLYKSRSCEDRKGSERPCWLPATFVVTRWGDPRRSFDAVVGAARLGRPRPRRAAWSIGPSRRRLRGANGPCSFRVDALSLKSPLTPQRRSDRPEARSPRTVLSLAGDSSLAFSQNPAVLRGTAGWLRSELRAGLAPWLQAPVSSAPSSRPPPTPDFHLPPA